MSDFCRRLNALLNKEMKQLLRDNSSMLIGIVIPLMLLFLIVCAIAVTFAHDLLNAVLIFMGYSVVMSIIWIVLESPDLAITEAAVGAGITSVLFFVTLDRIHSMFKNASEKKTEEKEATSNEK